MVDSQLRRARGRPPKSRKPLRERRRVNLFIIPISYREWNKLHVCGCELVLVFEEDEDARHDQHRAIPPSAPSASLIAACHLVEIMDGLYIALANDKNDLPALRTFDGEPFTHVVQLHYKSPRSNRPRSLYNWGRRESPRNAPVQRLDLICPSIYLYARPDRMRVAPEQLHAAREFLSLALPYGSGKWWPKESRGRVGDKRGEAEARYPRDKFEADEGDDEDAQVAYLAPDSGLDDLLNEYIDPDEQPVNVLIVAPRRRAVDVLSVLFCYLSFLEGSELDDVANMDYFDQVWNKVTLERSSKFYVEQVAKCE